MSSRDRQTQSKRKPLFELEDDTPLQLRPGPPAPLADILADIDEQVPLRGEPGRTKRAAARSTSAALPLRDVPLPRPDEHNRWGSEARDQRGSRTSSRGYEPSGSHISSHAYEPMAKRAASATRAILDVAVRHDAERVYQARSAYEEAEADLYYLEQLTARPYTSYGPTRPSLPLLTLDNPIVMVIIAALSLLILFTLGGGSQLISNGRWGLSALSGNSQQDMRAAFAGVAGQYTLKAAPSVSVELIDAILASYGSPATGTGKAWYDLGIRYGIDPAFAVAFFIHESSAGTNPGWAGIKSDGNTTHNVGNIICAGYSRCYNRFRDYSSWEEGIEDWYRLIDVEYIQGRGTTTVAEIIPIYAPAFENDVQGYVMVVQRLVDNWRITGKP